MLAGTWGFDRTQAMRAQRSASYSDQPGSERPATHGALPSCPYCSI